MASPEQGASSLFAPETQIDHFTIIRLLGKGGMGEVYLARDTKLGRKVALKVLHTEQLGSEEAKQQFLFEAKVTARFNHPHIITIHAVGSYQGYPYVALEYLKGENLRQRIHKEQLSQKEVLRIILAVAQALQEAHRHQLLHRDLKPENIFLPKDGRVRVLDFGLAAKIQRKPSPPISQHHAPNPKLTREFSSVEKDVSESPELEQQKQELATTEQFPAPLDAQPTEDTSLSRASRITEKTIEQGFEDTEELTVFGEDEIFEGSGKMICGTPAYMSPEQWQRLDTTPASDIWALGILLYELLAGERPYDGPNYSALAIQVLSAEKAPQLEKSPKIPNSLIELVAACLEKEPDKRTNIEHIIETLEERLFQKHKTLQSDESPFRGLMPFTEHHADFFFGRSAEISVFLEYLREEPILPIVGPSGSGKSSFIQAGVFPRLREQGRWEILHMRPRRNPFKALAALLTEERVDELAKLLYESPGQLSLLLRRKAEKKQCKFLLFIDQLEELYTLVEQEEVRRRFMQAITWAADDYQDPIRVTFTLRDDFLGRLLGYTELRECLGRMTVLSNPEPNHLKEVIESPLKLVDCTFDDPTLLEELVQAVHGEPACLPLLQFTVQMLWERRDTKERTLLRSTYRDIGGVAGALATHAENILKGLLPEQIQVAKQLFLRLVTPESTRKVISEAEALENLPKDSHEVLKKLTESRLITTRKGRGDNGNEAELELAHESLIHTWGQLSRWLDESREERVYLAEAEQAAELWLKRGRREEEVWEGKALVEAQHLLLRSGIELPKKVRDFLDAGQKKTVREQQRNRLFYQVGLACLLLISAISGWAAWKYSLKSEEAQQQHQTALKEGQKARKQEAKSRHNLAKSLTANARADLGRKMLFQARSKIRTALEIEDSMHARFIWWKLNQSPQRWKHSVGSGVYSISLSPKESTMAIGSQSKSIALLDLRTLHTKLLTGHQDQVIYLTFSPNGKWLASASLDKTIRVWDWKSKKTIHTFHHNRQMIRTLVFHPSKSVLVSGGDDKKIHFWDLASGKRLRSLEGHHANVRSVVFHPKGHLLASSSQKKDIFLWDFPSGKLKKQLKEHQTTVSTLAFHPKGTWLASGSHDKTICLWNTKTWKCEKKLKGHSARILSLAFHKQGTLLASGSWDKTARIWDFENQKQLRLFSKHRFNVTTLCFASSGMALFTSGWDGGIRMWDLDAIQGKAYDKGHSSAVNRVVFHPTRPLIASGSWDKQLRIWNQKTGTLHKLLTKHRTAVMDLAFNATGSHLASVGLDKAIYIWDTQHFRLQRILLGHRQVIHSIDFHPNGRYLASAGDDTVIKLWDIKTGLLHKELHNKGGIWKLAFSPNGKFLATANQNKKIKLWDLESYTVAKTISGHTRKFQALAFSPKGRYLASGGLEANLLLHEIETGQQIKLGPHKSRLLSIAFHPNERLVAVSSANHKIYLWDIKARSCTILQGHHGEVNTIAFHPSGRYLVSGGDDRSVRLWQLPSKKQLWQTLFLHPTLAIRQSHHGWLSLSSQALSNPKGTRKTTPLQVALKQSPILRPTRWQHRIKQVAKRISLYLSPKVTPAHPKGHLCIQTLHNSVEIWSLQQDKMQRRQRISSLQKSLAHPKGCLTLSKQQVHLLPLSGPTTKVASEVQFLERHGEHLLLAKKKKVFLTNLKGDIIQQFSTGPFVTALHLSPKWLYAGYRNGQIKAFHLQTKAQYIFTLTPKFTSPLLLLKKGPSHTLFAGHASGDLVHWSLKTRSRLFQRRLHGAVQQLFFHKSKLLVISEQGSFLTQDLSTFEMNWCTLLKQIWQKVPSAWEDGKAIPRIPKTHPCAK